MRQQDGGFVERDILNGFAQVRLTAEHVINSGQPQAMGSALQRQRLISQHRDAVVPKDAGNARAAYLSIVIAENSKSSQGRLQFLQNLGTWHRHTQSPPD